MHVRMRKKQALAARRRCRLAALGGRRHGCAIANGDDDATERPITGSATASRPTEAALAETGGGTVTETEVDDEESKYEVEVTLDDGSQVDVQLDEEFNVVSSEDDDVERARGRLMRDACPPPRGVCAAGGPV